MGIFSKVKKLFSNNSEAEKYSEQLKKSSTFGDSLLKLSKKYTSIDSNYFMELEDILIFSDVGVNVVMDLVDRLKLRVARENITDLSLMNEIIVDELFLIYVGDDVLESKVNLQNGEMTVILVVGVNGVGKTTTIGKLAHKYKNMDLNVCLAAGDTFRAGATKQLELWASRVGCDIVTGVENSDPSSVVFDAIAKANETNADVLLIDTAGRLQNKQHLMKELEKIKKVISRDFPGAPHETLLVLDGTTGQNGVSQAKAFTDVTEVTGIVLTKLDGTSKGGIIIAIKELLNIPVKYVGLGEKAEDLEEFDIEKYIYGLFNNLF